MKREILLLNIGQAGVQIGQAIWELFCLEHDIKPDGSLLGNAAEECVSRGCLFEECPSGKMVPRSIQIDSEPTVVDEIRVGLYRNLFHSSSLINSIEDAANNYARGRHNVSHTIMPDVKLQLHRMVENCSNLQGFLLVNGIGGGTGSGLTSSLLSMMSQLYPKTTKIQLQVAPCSAMSSIVVEPYNCALSAGNDQQFSDISLMVDNETLYERCVKNLGVPKPTYTTTNRLLAQIFSSLTCAFRYDSTLSADMNHMQTNLVPYPRLHFPLVSYAPFISATLIDREIISTTLLTQDLFQGYSQLMKVNPMEDYYMCCFIQYRGPIAIQEVNRALMKIKMNPSKAVKFVDWCPTGFKVGLNSEPPLAVPGSGLAGTLVNACMYSNSSAMAKVWNRIVHKFNLIFKKRAFVHWYVSEGLEEGEFLDAQSEIMSNAQDYEEVTSSQNAPDEPRGDNENDEGNSTEKEPAKAPSQYSTRQSKSEEGSEKSDQSRGSNGPKPMHQSGNANVEPDHSEGSEEASYKMSSAEIRKLLGEEDKKASSQDLEFL